MIKNEYLLKNYWDGKIIDMHTHFFPHRMFIAIWNFFESFNWKIAYKDEPEALAENLKKLGAAKFTLLNYAHKKDVAQGLNEWTLEFSKKIQGSIPFFTLHPDDDGNAKSARFLLENGFRGLKVQPLVQNFYMNDKRMFPVYETLIEKNAWLIIHAGTAPYANEYVGMKYFRPLIKRFPKMKICVAHLGTYETDEFFELLAEHENMRMDTAMVFTNTEVFDNSFPKEKLQKLNDMADKIFFGSDYPNIPYHYEESINGLLRLGFDKIFYEKIFFRNALRDLSITMGQMN